MKFKLFAITAVVSVLLLVNTAQAAMTLKVIGRSPFHQPPLTSVEDLKQMIQTREADVKKGFDLTPQAVLFSAFMARTLNRATQIINNNLRAMLCQKQCMTATEACTRTCDDSNAPFIVNRQNSIPFL